MCSKDFQKIILHNQPIEQTVDTTLETINIKKIRRIKSSIAMKSLIKTQMYLDQNTVDGIKYQSRHRWDLQTNWNRENIDLVRNIIKRK